MNNNKRPNQAQQMEEAALLLLGHIFGWVRRLRCEIKLGQPNCPNVNGYISLKTIRPYRFCRNTAIAFLVLMVLMIQVFVGYKLGWKGFRQLDPQLLQMYALICFSISFCTFLYGKAIHYVSQGMLEHGLKFNTFLKTLPKGFVRKLVDRLFRTGNRTQLSADEIREIIDAIAGWEADEYVQKLYELFWDELEDTMFNKFDSEQAGTARETHKLEAKLTRLIAAAHAAGAWRQALPRETTRGTLYKWVEANRGNQKGNRKSSPIRFQYQSIRKQIKGA